MLLMLKRIQPDSSIVYAMHHKTRYNYENQSILLTSGGATSLAPISISKCFYYDRKEDL